MRPSLLILLPVTLLLSACERTEKDSVFVPDDNTDDSGTGNTDDSSITDDSGTTGDGDYLEPVAVGFEYLGNWDQDLDVLEPYFLFPDLNDTNGGPLLYASLVNVSLASTAYFSMEADDPNIDYEHCDFLAYFISIPGPVTIEEFDWESGVGGSGVPLESWGTYDGYLIIRDGSLDDTCFDLDPAVFENGDPISTFDGMHFGLGFGPLSPYNETRLSDVYAEEWPDYEDSYMSQYIAINHPDGAGGYTFTAYDWNSALLVETDYGVCADFDNGSGGTDEVCGEVQVDADADVYILGDVYDQPIHGNMLGNAYWYEDFPNLDLSILKEGVPAI